MSSDGGAFLDHANLDVAKWFALTFSRRHVLVVILDQPGKMQCSAQICWAPAHKHYIHLQSFAFHQLVLF
jgi:hypothetical protein